MHQDEALYRQMMLVLKIVIMKHQSKYSIY